MTLSPVHCSQSQMIILIPVQKRERVGWGGGGGEAQACMHAKLLILLVSITTNQLRDAHLLQLVGSAKLGRNVFCGAL